MTVFIRISSIRDRLKRHEMTNSIKNEPLEGLKAIFHADVVEMTDEFKFVRMLRVVLQIGRATFQ